MFLGNLGWIIDGLCVKWKNWKTILACLNEIFETLKLMERCRDCIMDHKFRTSIFSPSPPTFLGLTFCITLSYQCSTDRGAEGMTVASVRLTLWRPALRDSKPVDCQGLWLSWMTRTQTDVSRLGAPQLEPWECLRGIPREGNSLERSSHKVNHQDRMVFIQELGRKWSVK